MFPELDTIFDMEEISQKCLALWEDKEVHKFKADSGKEVFSIDTPPPYVSASHLHVGHAMSYTQAEIIVRYQRMKGKEVFYPMGFDDNGLPTERHVEMVHNIKDKSQISRSEFRKLCRDETQKGGKAYELYGARLVSPLIGHCSTPPLMSVASAQGNCLLLIYLKKILSIVLTSLCFGIRSSKPPSPKLI